jgi:hypothetical protein
MRGVAAGSARGGGAADGASVVASEVEATGQPRAAASDGAPDAAAGVPAIAPTMVIRTGSAAVEVDSLDAAIAGLRALAAQVGGYVAGTTLAGGREQVRSASLELRVPAARFDALMSGLRPLGRVERIDVQAQDVGEEFVDVSARVANAQRLEARLVALLERRTGRLEDVLAVERELARVREEVERHEGRLRWLRTRVATSTLTVALHEPFPIVGRSPATSPVGEAFRDAWRNFVTLVAAVIAASGVWLPVGALALAAWRWRRHRAPRPFPPPAT